jgi:hypothetical protein
MFERLGDPRKPADCVSDRRLQMVETETVLDVVPDLVPSQAAPATGKNARRSYQKHGFTQPCEADEGG